MGESIRDTTAKETGRSDTSDTDQAKAVPRTDLEIRLERYRKRSEAAAKKATEKKRRRFFDPL